MRVCLVTGYGYVLAAAVLALCYASAANLLAKRHAQSKASHVQVFSRGKDGGNEHAPRGHADETPPACGGTSGALARQSSLWTSSGLWGQHTDSTRGLHIRQARRGGRVHLDRLRQPAWPRPAAPSLCDHTYRHIQPPALPPC